MYLKYTFGLGQKYFYWCPETKKHLRIKEGAELFHNIRKLHQKAKPFDYCSYGTEKRNDKYFQYFRIDKVENQLCFSDIGRYLKNYNSFEGGYVKPGAVFYRSSNTWGRTICPY